MQLISAPSICNSKLISLTISVVRLSFLMCSVTYCVQLKNYREKGWVMVVKADEVPKFQEKLKSLLAES